MRVALVVLALLAGSVAAAPRGHVAFRAYGTEDGLAALDVDVGTQDREGFVWAASPNGLFRFDGARFRRFGVDDGLPSTLFTDLVVGPDGTLWGATSRGVVYRAGERFVALGVGTMPPDGFHRLAFDAGGRLWVTTDAGPFVLDRTQRFEPAQAWPGGASFGIFVDHDRTLWIGRGSRLVSQRADTSTWVDAGHDFRAPITDLVEDSEGRMWIRAGRYLWMRSHPGGSFEDRSELGGAHVVPTSVRLTLDAHGHVLVPTADGLVELSGGRPRRLATDLPADALNIKSAWLDREGGLWVTSLGLHHERGRGLWRSISTSDGLPSNNVWSVRGLRDGRIAVGTDGGLVLLSDEGTERVTERATFATVEDDAGGLWIASDTLSRRDPATGAVRAYGVGDGLPSGAPRTLARTHDGRIWVGMDAGGLVRTVGPDRFELVALPEVSSSRVWAIAADGDRLWITTSAGLFLHDGERWQRFAKRDGLADDGTTFLLVRRDHDVCVSFLSVGGVQCVRYAAGSLRTVARFDESSGLTSPIPYSLAEDDQGRLWVGGAQGVAIIGAGTVARFRRASGAPGDDCNSGAIWVAPDGRVWLGTSTGLGIFDAPRFVGAAAPRVTLLDGELGNRHFDRATWPSAGEPTLDPEHGSLSVEFAALSFLDPRRLEYAVRLDGIDDGWRPSSGAAVYDRLAAGGYTLRVRARESGGAWGPATTVQFAVRPWWWQTWWFRVLVALGAAALVAGVVRWRLRGLRRHNTRLEALIEARTKELVRANEQVALGEKLSALGRVFAQLSHELNNPLNVVLNNVAPLQEYMATLRHVIEATRELANDPVTRASLDALWSKHELDFVFEDSDQAFEIVADAVKRLTRIHGDLRTFLRGQAPATAFVDLGPSLRTTALTFARAFPNVSLRNEVPPLPPLDVDEVRILQVVTNLIQNAIDAMGGAGTITLRADVDAEHVHIRIADSGPGVPHELRGRVFEPFFTTKDVGKGLGLGLAISRETIVAHGGTLRLDDTVSGGACFVISLPLSAKRVVPVMPAVKTTSAMN